MLLRLRDETCPVDILLIENSPCHVVTVSFSIISREPPGSHIPVLSMRPEIAHTLERSKGFFRNSMRYFNTGNAYLT